MADSSAVRQPGDSLRAMVSLRVVPAKAYAAADRLEDGVAIFWNNQRRWLWVRAFAGTTGGEYLGRVLINAHTMSAFGGIAESVAHREYFRF